MLKIKHHILYKKDLKKLIKNGFDLKLLYKAVENLAKERPLDPKYKATRSKALYKRF